MACCNCGVVFGRHEPSSACRWWEHVYNFGKDSDGRCLCHDCQYFDFGAAVCDQEEPSKCPYFEYDYDNEGNFKPERPCSNNQED